MKNAVLTVPNGTSGLRFEVHSTPSRGHSSVQKWYVKANHPVEAQRWITAIQKSIEIAKRDGERAEREDCCGWEGRWEAGVWERRKRGSLDGNGEWDDGGNTFCAGVRQK